MSARRRWSALLAVLAVTTALLLPLQLLVGSLGPVTDGLAAREAEGSLWSGGLRGASWRGRPLGDLKVGLRPLPLLLGNRVFAIRGDDLSLRMLLGRRRGVEGMNASIEALALPGLPAIDVDLRFADVALVFADGRCTRAEGRVQASLRWAGREDVATVLSGTPECAERAMVLPLRADGGTPRIQAELRLEADGRYRLHAVVGDADPTAAALLRQSGFVDAPGGLSRSIDGRLAD